MKTLEMVNQTPKKKETLEDIAQKHGKEISELTGVEFHTEQFVIREQSSTGLSNEKQQLIKPDVMGLFNYTEREIIIFQDRVAEKSNEMERIFKVARLPIQGREEIQEFVRRCAIIHELAHANHFTIEPTIFEKQSKNLEQSAKLSQEIIQNQQELQSLIFQLEKLSQERKFDLEMEVNELPDDIRGKAERLKNLSTKIIERKSALQSLNDNFLTNLVFSEAIADVITSKIVGNRKNAYYLLAGKSPEYKNLGFLEKITTKTIESSIRASSKKRGVDPKLLELRTKGIEFIDNITQKFKGDIKATFKFIIETPPFSIDEIKYPENYLKRVKSDSNFE